MMTRVFHTFRIKYRIVGGFINIFCRFPSGSLMSSGSQRTVSPDWCRAFLINFLTVGTHIMFCTKAIIITDCNKSERFSSTVKGSAMTGQLKTRTALYASWKMQIQTNSLVSVSLSTSLVVYLFTNIYTILVTLIQPKITYCLSTFRLHVGSLHQDWLPVPVVSM